MFDFPALFQASDLQSNVVQKKFLRSIKIQYFSLALASISLYIPSYRGIFDAVFIVFLILSFGVSFYLLIKSPEKEWYSLRALAESVKTRTWLFCVGAEPFPVSAELNAVSDLFTEDLKEILRTNRAGRENLNLPNSEARQITETMIEIRSMSLAERSSFYHANRIKNQKSWYHTKAKWNSRRAKFWMLFSIVTHFLILAALISALKLQIELASVPIQTALVIASSALGWRQIKKFSENAAAYSATAQEIAFVEDKISRVKSESEFQSFIIETERLFSREHTQWVARRNQ